LLQRNLPKEEKDSLRRIKKFARDGKNLNHFLSRRRMAADFTDALFVSWKILHFHLGPPSGGMVAGTSRLLFARVEPRKMYFIDVLDHSSFSDQALLQIVESNWPELNAGAQLKGILGVKRNATNDEIAKLRAAGVNVLTQIGSKVLAPIGGGLATDRSSALAALDAMQLKKAVGEVERRLREEPACVAASLGVQVDQLPANLRFKLHVVGDQISVRETTMAKTVAEWTIARTP
jgi:hypothetical protein